MSCMILDAFQTINSQLATATMLLINSHVAILKNILASFLKEKKNERTCSLLMIDKKKKDQGKHAAHILACMHHIHRDNKRYPCKAELNQSILC